MQTRNCKIDLTTEHSLEHPYFRLLKYLIVLKIQTNLSRINLQPSFLRKIVLDDSETFAFFLHAAVHMSRV